MLPNQRLCAAWKCINTIARADISSVFLSSHRCLNFKPSTDYNVVGRQSSPGQTVGMALDFLSGAHRDMTGH